MDAFTVSGSPRSVSEHIEQFARAQGSVTALVVPWESSSSMLSMAVTAVKIDGWAIEHTNLGTITLTADGDATQVAAVADTVHGKIALTALFDQFVRDLRPRLARGTEVPRARDGGSGPEGRRS